LKRPISLNSFKVVLIHGWHPTQKKEEDAKAVKAVKKLAEEVVKK